MFKEDPHEATRAADGRFGAGNPGKPQGARHAVSRRLVQAMVADFAQHGGHLFGHLRNKAPVFLLNALLEHATDADFEAAVSETETALSHRKYGRNTVSAGGSRPPSATPSCDCE